VTSRTSPTRETTRSDELSIGISWQSIVSGIRIQAQREPPALRAELDEWADLIQALAAMGER
jgi:hypothetical protein